MFEKIKKKIGYSLRLYGYQIAMSIFSLMICLPVFSRPLYRAIAASVSILLYYIIIYFTSHDAGEKDFVGRNNPIIPPKAYDGFIYAIVSQMINVIVIILYIFFTQFYILLYFSEFMYSPLNFIHAETVNDISHSFTAIWYLIATLPQIAVSGIAYLFGYKGIKISKLFGFDKTEIHSNPRSDNPNFDK